MYPPFTHQHLGLPDELAHCVSIGWGQLVTLRAKLTGTCIIISPVCGFVCVCVWVCYHDNSKLRESIFTKLGL